MTAVRDRMSGTRQIALTQASADMEAIVRDDPFPRQEVLQRWVSWPPLPAAPGSTADDAATFALD